MSVRVASVRSCAVRKRNTMSFSTCTRISTKSGCSRLSIQNGLPVLCTVNSRVRRVSKRENKGSGSGARQRPVPRWMSPSTSVSLASPSIRLGGGALVRLLVELDQQATSRAKDRARSRVTFSKWRSRMRPVMIVCSSTIGATRMISARGNSPSGMWRSRKRVEAAVEPVLRHGLSARSVDMQHIARTAHRLQIDGIRRIVLDLLAQPVDLHIDAAGALLRASGASSPRGTGCRHARPACAGNPARAPSGGSAPRLARNSPRCEVEDEGTEGHLGCAPRRLLLAPQQARIAAAVRAARRAWRDSRRCPSPARRCGRRHRQAPTASAPARGCLQRAATR